MHVHHPLPRVVRQIEATGCAVTSVGEEEIDRSVVVLDRFTQTGDRSFVGYIEAHAPGVPVDRLGNFDGLCLVEVSDDNEPRSLGSEGMRTRTADAASAAGDYTDAIIQFHDTERRWRTTPGVNEDDSRTQIRWGNVAPCPTAFPPMTTLTMTSPSPFRSSATRSCMAVVVT